MFPYPPELLGIPFAWIIYLALGLTVALIVAIGIRAWHIARTGKDW